MNFEDIQTSSSASVTNIPNDLTKVSIEPITDDELNKSHAEVNTADVPEDVKLNEFLDLLKVSCQMNEMITKTASSPTNSTGNVNSRKNPQPKSEIVNDLNLDQLAENQLVNELFGHSKVQQTHNTSPPKDETLSLNSNQNEFSQSTSNDRSRARRRSTFGTTASIYYKSHLNKPDENATTASGLHPKLNEKLDYVINEGVLDAVLPFICPVPVPNKFPNRNKSKAKDASTTKQNFNIPSPECPGDGNSSTMVGDAGSAVRNMNVEQSKTKERQQHQQSQSFHKSISGKQPTLGSELKELRDMREPEVIIHVCDEVKNTKRDFSCSQRLLVTKMGYFADVTAGQRLEDMDISVHCDIQIFDWLMRWVKYNGDLAHRSASSSNENVEPVLEASNVVPILVSASFLQMEPLLLECLSFCHSNLNDVVRSSTNLSCVNDGIITRLAAMFTNLELEEMRDKKERLTPRLWTKLIQSLFEPEPEALRGHYYSLSGLFRCVKCGKCLTNTTKTYITCTPGNMRLNRWGQLISQHVRDSSWDVNYYIVQLFKELKSWRRVYWKLWGHSHVLYCCQCEAHFQVYQLHWCRYHPEHANYLGPVTEGRLAGPTGRYPCCGHQAFRYESLPGPNGCQFREHSVLVETDRERAILSLVQLVSEAQALCENPPARLQESILSPDSEPRWYGLPLTPSRHRFGLLPVLNLEATPSNCTPRRMRQMNATHTAPSSESDTSDTFEDYHQRRRRFRYGKRYSDSSSSSDGCESDHMSQKQLNVQKSKPRPTDIPGRYWSGELSARSNQDHQREYEEKVMKHVIAIVNKRHGSEQTIAQQPVPLAGSYVRLEAEWKDQLKQRHSNSNNANNGNNNNGNNNGNNNNSNNQISFPAGTSNSNSQMNINFCKSRPK